uniref:Uncharacterized protein n=1 Tax=viral metagenome TaxID=1070528 RepID=A0A6M3J143_9ZZZZ
MATYRARVLGSEAAANGDVHLDVYIQRETEPAVWVDVPNGHRTMVLNGRAVLAITESAQTDAQKRAALVELMRQTAAAWGIDESDEANEQLTALVPGGYPVNVTL